MQQEKQKYADSLIRLLQKKKLSEITVKDIAAECGVTRQAFYYHFSDIYELVEWIYTDAAQKALEGHADIDDWEIGFLMVLKWVKENSVIVENTLRSITREYAETFLNRVLGEYITPLVQRQAEGMLVTEDQKKFIARFYTLSLNSITIDWILSGMKEEPDELVRSVSILIRGNIRQGLDNFEKENRRKKQEGR